MKKIATSHTAFSRLFFLCLLLMSVGHLWSTDANFTLNSSSASLSEGEITLSGGSKSNNGYSFDASGVLTITANTGYVIMGASITYSDNKEDRYGGSPTVASSTHYSYSRSTVTGTISLKDGGTAQSTVTLTTTNKARITAMTVTYASSATPRTFKSGQVIYFKDTWKAQGNGSTWKISDGNICAKFEGDGTAWYNCSGSDNVSGSWNAENTIYRITVPGSEKEYTSVTFTRGTNTSSDDGVWNRTTKETPEIGRNMFCVKNTTSDSNYEGWWEKYAPNPALIGDFNNWDPDANVFGDYNSNVGATFFTLDTEAKTYGFKVLEGESYYSYDNSKAGWTITNTTTTSQTFYTGNDDSKITSTEVGEYMLKYNKSTHTFVAACYPKERLTKGTIVYFDGRVSDWSAAAYTAKFLFKYYDSDSQVGELVFSRAPLENWVYYATVPNNDYVGMIQIMRMNPNNDNDQYNYANTVSASARTSVMENCLISPSSGWDGITPTWGTYCPPMSSTTLSDNSTTKISWQTGNGTKANPYLVEPSATIQVTASATSAISDANMTKKFDFKVNNSSAQDDTETTFEKGSLSNNTTYKISVDAYNSYNSTNSTKSTPDTLWYKALTTYSVTHTKTNVTKSAGREGSAAAAYYQPYTATFAGSTGYNLPATITVKFGETTKTADTDYTWNSSTGVVSIPADKIDGNVTITVSGVAKTTTLTFDPNTANHGTSGDGGATATYGSSSLASITHTTPADGYVLDGYYTTASGEGTKIINANGSLVASTTYTTADSEWNSELSSLTLYARYEEEIVCPNSASGETVYKFVTKGSGLGTDAVCALADTDYPLTTSDALTTLTGGTLTAKANEAGTTNLSYNNSSLKFQSGAKGWLILGLNCTIQEGDVIRYINSGTTNAYVAIQTNKGTTTNQIVLQGNGSTTVQTVTITAAQATAFAELSTVYMVRIGTGTAYISYFEILRPYAVTFDANTNGGKIGGADKDTLYFAADEPQALPHASKNDYRFKGWYTTSDGNTKASDPYTATASTTLYAQYEDCSSPGSVYKFQVKSGLTNGNVGITSLTEFNTGDYLSELMGGTLSGYASKTSYLTIAGTNSFSFENNNTYLKVDLDCPLQTGDTIKSTTANKKFVIYKTDSKSGEATDITLGPNQVTIVPADLNEAGTLYIFRSGSNTPSPTISYFEIIRPAKYTITYAAGASGSGSIDAGTKIHNADFTLSSSTFSRAGATQDGWSTSDGGDKAYELGDTYTTNADITLYPHWVHTITYHSATADDYEIENIEDGADIDDAYIPAYCAADRVFVGWATSEVSTQQSEPTIVSEDGMFDSVTSDMDLYAVFANRSGGKVTDSVTVSEGFETYSTSTNYAGPNRKFSNSTTGLSWIIDYGNVTTTGASSIFSSVKDVILNAKQATSNLRSSAPVDDLISVSLRSARNNGSIYGTLKWTTDTASWPGANIKVLSLSKNDLAFKDSVYFKHPQRTFIKVSNYVAVVSNESRYIYIDSIVFTKAVANYYYTDYSTTCTSGSATITWENNGGSLSAGTQPTDTTIRSWKQLPTVTRANYRFDGWKATINGELKSDVYEAGEWFLIGHDVTLTAQWTRYIEDIEGVSPITTGNGIAVRSYEIDSIVVNSGTATTPTANKVGTDASMFIVTIDAANKRVADGKTHFPYYITYTPSSHNITSSVDISFTCDGVESSAITVRGRSLPEEFVIAVKNGSTWVALPNDLASTLGAQSNIVPVEIAVDNSTTPTSATFAPSNTSYKTTGKKNSGHVTSLRFTVSGSNYLRSTTSNEKLCLATSNYDDEDWILSSSDLSVYSITLDPALSSSRIMGLYTSGGKTYMGHPTSSTNSDIFLLPIETKADYIDATVTSWAQSHIEVTLAAELDVDAVTAKLGATSDDATEITGSGTQYGITFDDLDLSDKSGEKLVLVWKKNSSTIGASIVTIPSIVAPSAEVSAWSAISATADDIVVIKSDVTVDATDAVAKAVVLTDDHKLTIGANKALVVTGKITREDGSPTTAADLVIKSTSSGNGTLIFENDGNEATVEMYSKASAAAKPWSWQYMAVPFTSTNPLSSYYGSYMYEWPSDCSTWQPVTRNTTLTAFTGYLISNPSANYTYSMEGELAPTEDDVVIDVPAGKEMVVGNSWTGPIQITQMTTEDFSKVTATIYLFNTGMDSEEQGAATPDAGDRYAPGTYVTIPINEAEDVGVTKISSLQGFYVEQNNTEYAGQDGSLTLSYSKHVRPTGANTVDNGPMHAPKRVNAEERPTLLKIKVSGSRYDDRLILLEREDFSTGFDNGWDGKKLDEPGEQPMLYTTRPDGTPDAVSAIPEMDGTVISFRKGEDSNYTLRFEYAEDNDELYIFDTKTQQTTRVLSGNTYTFNTSNNDTPARFLLTRSNAPQITTGNANANANAEKATKLILNQQLYIYRNGILYDATGRRVDSFSVGSGFDANANANANAEQEKGGAE